MTDHRNPYPGELADAQARCATNLPRRIYVVGDEMGIRGSSAEVPIRHETNSLVKNISMSRKQIRTGNGASECQL